MVTVPEVAPVAGEGFSPPGRAFFSALQVSEHPEDDGHGRGQQQSQVGAEQQYGG